MKQRAIVMGASSGIGREVAERLIKAGWQVGVAARRESALETIAAPDGKPPVVARIDARQGDAGLRLRALIERMGGVELYFHAAGVGWQNPGLEEDKEMDTVATNAAGFTRMVGEAFRWMADHGGGHIAVISSVAGTKGLGAAPGYSATKAYQNTYIQALEQLSRSRRLGIMLTDLRPGFVDTALIAGSRFPMTMAPGQVADKMVRALGRRRRVCVIDWRWRIVVAAWRLLPACLWRRMPLGGAAERGYGAKRPAGRPRGPQARCVK